MNLQIGHRSASLLNCLFGTSNRTITKAGLSLPISGGHSCYAAGCQRYRAEVSFCFLLAICNDHYKSLEMTHLQQASSVFKHYTLFYFLLLLTWLRRPSISLKKHTTKHCCSSIFDLYLWNSPTSELSKNFSHSKQPTHHSWRFTNRQEGQSCNTRVRN